MKASHSKASNRKPVRVKVEKVEGNQIQSCRDEHDLTYHVKDRVELMKQVFSILKERELLAMAPDCLRYLKADELQEALLDEVLGISSKRLHSIVEGLECPSNTDSSEDSSAEVLETISLDSISSDDEILSHQDQKSKKKHIKKKSKAEKLLKKKGKSSQDTKNANAKVKKSKKENSTNEPQVLEDGAGNGMTVLELLELQARARAIRAQLAAVEVKDNDTQEIDENDDSDDSSESDEDEVVIKEEPPDIVEIASSSDETEKESTEKSNMNAGLRKSSESIQNQSADRISPAETSAESSVSVCSSNTQNLLPRKIKLNRTNLLVSVANSSKNAMSSSNSLPKYVSENISANKVAQSKSSPSKNKKSNEKIDQSDLELLEKIKNSNTTIVKPLVLKKSIVRERKESDGDELTLELSDSEKLYLLEGFHSPKSDDAGNGETNKNAALQEEINKDSENKALDSITNKNIETDVKSDDLNGNTEIKRKRKINNISLRKRIKIKKSNKNLDSLNKSENISNLENIAEEGNVSDEKVGSLENSLENETDKIVNKSDGECSYSAEEEMEEQKSEIFCISDDELPNPDNVSVETNDKNKNDVCNVSESVSMNEENGMSIQSINDILNVTNDEKNEFHCVMETSDIEFIIKNDDKSDNIKQTEIIVNNYETGNTFDCVFEISDNSEDDTRNVFSKEPTREEIIELSKKIDYEIERENLDILGDSNIDLKINDNEKTPERENQVDVSVEGVSWKTRWLNSNKVQRVLATSNLCNALRKKNIELKKKLENNATKIAVQTEEKLSETSSELPCAVEDDINNLDIEGSVSQYEKLMASTKYVDPVPEPKIEEKAMVNDAQQIMKMYKKLLKIHSLDVNEDSSKKKSKKNKKDKKRDKKEKKKNKKLEVNPSENELAVRVNMEAEEQQSENIEETLKLSE